MPAPIDDVIAFLEDAHEAAMAMGDAIPGGRSGVTFTSEVIFMLSNLLREERDRRRTHERISRCLAVLAFGVSVGAMALGVWNMAHR